MISILENREFQKKLSSIAKESKVSIEQVKEDAAEYLRELYSVHNPYLDVASMQAIQFILGRAYDSTIDVNPVEIKELAKLMRRHPVAFVMTHKTYIDMFVLALVLSRHGLPLPFVFAGINMAFFGLAQIGRNAGAIFIRRSIKGNETYKATLRHYVSTLVDQGSHFMWAIEGTRSRTGKLVWPKMGILKYIQEGEDLSAQEVKYIPVSVVYDLIPDVKEMTEEGRGKEKKEESLAWFMDYIRKMSKNHGKISLRLGEPVGRDNLGKAFLPEAQADDIFDEKFSISKFAFDLVHNINQVTPVTTTSLVCISLLSKFALTKKQLETDIHDLMELIESHKPDALVDRGKSINECVQKAINLLVQSKLIHQLGDGISTKYSIVARNFLSATYYANMASHHFYHRAFIELAFAKIKNSSSKDRLTDFWTEIMDLRDLFKFEFFYSNRSDFSDEIEEDLKFIESDWEEKIGTPKHNLLNILKSQKVLVSQVVLHNYVEAYKVVAQGLQKWPANEEFDEKRFLKLCLFLGEEMHWQGRIHRVESVSKPFLTNGIRLIKNLDLIPNKKSSKKIRINRFAARLEDITDRVEQLQTITISKPEKETALIPLERNVVPGSKTQSVTQTVIDGESGPHIGAFFDLDRTLIKGFSAKQFFQTRLLSGKMTPKEILAQFAGVLVYASGNGNFASLASIGAQGIVGVKEKVFMDLGEEVYMNDLADSIYPESRALVAAHMAKGHTVAIVSAATPYQVNPIARDLGIDHIMCTRMEVINGKFTGKIVEPACWGEGKAYAGRQLAETMNLDLTKSFFYTDSAEDMPLMEIVGHPIPVNPDNKLSSKAFLNDWPVFRFDDENRVGASNVFRTFLAMGSLIPAAWAGLASGMFSMSKRDGINSMIGLVGELGTRMGGIHLVVKNEKNLWKKRPCVFIFNHQSNADLFIVAKLVKRDTMAVAKQELKMTPIGPLFMAAGVIFVDRKNKDKAIEAMQPAVEALQNGKSLAIAPEGTRSYDYSLGKFKKGAFHLAMQARVPIVPIVIRNAHDVMPRGSAVFKPTVVEATIMKPVETKDWKKADLNIHIKNIRNIFLNELGQELEK